METERMTSKASSVRGRNGHAGPSPPGALAAADCRRAQAASAVRAAFRDRTSLPAGFLVPIGGCCAQYALKGVSSLSDR
eukprot:9495683-Pyramimonas_sp.AAC.1